MQASGPTRVETPWNTRLFDRFWEFFRVKRTYNLGVEYRCLAEKQPIKVAVNVEYSKFLWDRSIGSNPVRAHSFGGSTAMGGDPLAIAIITEVNVMNGRFLRSELLPMASLLQENLRDRIAWLDVKILSLELYQYAQAFEEKKGKKK